jgi:hypothetical protein
MTHIEFTAYHNRIIKFRTKNSTRWRKGLILDIRNYGGKKYSTHYSFISLISLRKWKIESRNGRKTIKRLEKDIDIKTIAEAKVINYKTGKSLKVQPKPFKLIE